MKIRFFYGLILSLLLAFLLSSCAPQKESVQLEVKPPSAAVDSRPEWQIEWDRTVAEAKKEGKVVVYGAYGLADARDIFIDAVKKRYGLEMNMVVARGPQLAARLITERRAGLYLADVYLGGATTIVTSLLPEKILEPIEPYLILPEIKDPGLWLEGKLPIWDKERRAFSSLAQVSSRAAINTSFLKPEEITSYQDLLKPKWKGKIIMSDPSTQGSGFSWFTLAHKIMGENYIKEMVKQEPLLTRDSRQISEWLARGKYFIGLGIDTGATKNFIQAGASLWIIPKFKEGVELRGSSGHVGMINRPLHSKAAKVFINWILSRDGQIVFSRSNGVASRRIDVPTDHLEPWQIPDPKMTYISGETEEAQLEEFKMIELAKELFASLLK